MPHTKELNSSPLQLLVASVRGCEASCQRELEAEFSSVEPATSALFLATGAIEPPVLAFARQILPYPQKVQGQTVREFVDAMFQVIDASEGTDPIVIHVFPQFEASSKGAGERRCELIHEGITELLRRRAYGKFKLLQKSQNIHSAATLVQLCLSTPHEGFLSLLPASRYPEFASQLSPFPGGQVKIPPDNRPPSRAYRKLLEAEIRFGDSIRRGNHVVDLGGSPGGWTYIALHRGADVVAIDRAPLREDLMDHRGLSFRKGDGFKFTPQGKVDWMLCDVVAFPERTQELLANWFKHKWMKKFCITFKFRGDKDLALLKKVKALLKENTQRFVLTALDSNRNEVTAIGEVQR